eukprot:8249634-Alexandrium_andersonii.AAC.2
MGRKNCTIAGPSGQSSNPARGGRRPRRPNGPNGPLHGSESAKVGVPPSLNAGRRRRLDLNSRSAP